MPNKAKAQTDTIIEILHKVRGMGDEINQIEKLFEKRRGRNPHALGRMRQTISELTLILTPVLHEATQQEVTHGQEKND